jgi:hypothetical protein
VKTRTTAGNNIDKNEIIFFSKVVKTAEPFPRIKIILRDKEFNTMFGNVISK